MTFQAKTDEVIKGMSAGGGRGEERGGKEREGEKRRGEGKGGEQRGGEGKGDTLGTRY